MRIVLCRHAEAGNVAQADRLARALEALDFAAVYTSPLERAFLTARRLADAPIVIDDLREIELGDLAGLQFEQYPAELQAALLSSPATLQFPSGESYEQLRARVVAALDGIVASHPDDTVAVVSHAGAIRAALAAWLCVAPDASFRIDQSFAAVNVVDWTDGVPFVRLVNGGTLGAVL